ncbi:transcriptional regulator, RpiR family [Devosia sp. YR412]|uniref:MurR/RpiR family transcriptional regulator n=1 Tax=Devosia sp. YR412 TaxID=1881030 RepID=UPI0008BA3959|nr:MurR/RpiR family transcriptional regulator [Devosia sp. YR412]SEP64439.1 transcriptional regulator, RpiR family [Devosia sp. YR412]
MSDDFSTRMQSSMASLPATMRRVALYFDQNRAEVMSRSASELARTINTSDASVIRTAKALGYAGLPELKRSLADQMAEVTPAEAFDRTMKSANADARRAAAQTLLLQHSQVAELQGEAQLESLMSAAGILHGARRIGLFGIGPTAHLTGYMAHLLLRHGREVWQLDATGRGLADGLLGLRQGDAMLAFSYGRPYAEIELVVAEAAGLGIPVLLVTDNATGKLARQVDAVIAVPRGEARGMALHGSTMVWLETLVVALSLLGGSRTTTSLKRLSRLRSAL